MAHGAVITADIGSVMRHGKFAGIPQQRSILTLIAINVH